MCLGSRTRLGVSRITAISRLQQNNELLPKPSLDDTVKFAYCNHPFSVSRKFS